MIVALSIRHTTRIHVCFTLLLTSIKTSYDIAQPKPLYYKSLFFPQLFITSADNSVSTSILGLMRCHSIYRTLGFITQRARVKQATLTFLKHLSHTASIDNPALHNKWMKTRTMTSWGTWNQLLATDEPSSPVSPTLDAPPTALTSPVSRSGPW